MPTLRPGAMHSQSALHLKSAVSGILHFLTGASGASHPQTGCNAPSTPCAQVRYTRKAPCTHALHLTLQQLYKNPASAHVIASVLCEAISSLASFSPRGVLSGYLEIASGFALAMTINLLLLAIPTTCVPYSVTKVIIR